MPCQVTVTSYTPGLHGGAATGAWTWVMQPRAPNALVEPSAFPYRVLLHSHKSRAGPIASAAQLAGWLSPLPTRPLDT